jgi:hypothetical protein
MVLLLSHPAFDPLGKSCWLSLLNISQTHFNTSTTHDGSNHHLPGLWNYSPKKDPLFLHSTFHRSPQGHCCHHSFRENLVVVPLSFRQVQVLPIPYRALHHFFDCFLSPPLRSHHVSHTGLCASPYAGLWTLSLALTCSWDPYPHISDHQATPIFTSFLTLPLRLTLITNFFFWC